MATYYVMVKTQWYTDSMKPCAGPFKDKSEAEAVALIFSENGFTMPVWSEERQAYLSQEKKLSLETEVVSKHRMNQKYGWTANMAHKHIKYVERIRSNQKDWEKYYPEMFLGSSASANEESTKPKPAPLKQGCSWLDDYQFPEDRQPRRYNRTDSDGTPLIIHGNLNRYTDAPTKQGDHLLLLDMPMCPACFSDHITNGYDEETDNLTIYCRSCGRHWSLE